MQAMDLDRLSRLLESIQSGEISIEEGIQRLRDLPYDDLGFARIDNHRTIRQGQKYPILNMIPSHACCGTHLIQLRNPSSRMNYMLLWQVLELPICRLRRRQLSL
jgi:hypothetical protein